MMANGCDNHHVDAEGSAVIAKIKRRDYLLLDRIKQTHWYIATYDFALCSFHCQDISLIGTIDCVEQRESEVVDA